MGKKYPTEWEDINAYTFRLKVFGGWIVKHMNIWSTEYSNESSLSICFVPDIKHEWELED